MTIFLAADHAGFKLKEEIIAMLNADEGDDSAQGIDLQREVIDLGPDHFEESDDYPLYAELLAQEVVKKKSSRGILCCYSGNGMAIAANKVKGARCGVGFSTEAAKLTVEHNQANILAVPAGLVSLETARDIVSAFLQAKPSQEERHWRRKAEIDALEANLAASIEADK